MKLKSKYLIKPTANVRLSHLKTDEDGGYKNKEAAAAVLVKRQQALANEQELLWASQQKALLIVLQGDGHGRQGRYDQPHLLGRQSARMRRGLFQGADTA